MNIYCDYCNLDCKEIIPTYNCKYQMESENIINILNEFKNQHKLVCDNVDSIIEKIQTPIIETVKETVKEIQYVKQNISDIDFNNRNALYEQEFGLGYLGTKIDNKLILISLICSFVLAARKKDPSLTTLKAIDQLTGYSTMDNISKIGGSNYYYENLAIMCDSFLCGVKEGNTFGIKDVKSLKDKVNSILSEHSPF